jgi:hypothetical protein
MKKKTINEMYGQPKIAPTKYAKLPINELSNTFKSFNSEKLNSYFTDSCFMGIRNYYDRSSLIENLMDDNFTNGLIQYFSDEVMSIYIHTPYEYNEFYMPEDLIAGYEKQVSKETFNEICQKVAELRTIFELKIPTVEKKEFIYFFSIIYCIAKLTDGLVVMDNVWFGDLENDIKIKRVYDINMLEELLKYWVWL